MSITCEQALEAIQQDPLTLSPDVLAHVRTCPACAEARVMWVAQEPVLPALAPSGYFEALPDRIVRKLPTPRRTFSKGSLWAAAIALAILAGGTGGYLAGRVNRTPLQTATVPPPTVYEEALPEAPFTNKDESLAGLASLTPAERKAFLERLKAPTP